LLEPLIAGIGDTRLWQLAAMEQPGPYLDSSAAEPEQGHAVIGAFVELRQVEVQLAHAVSSRSSKPFTASSSYPQPIYHSSGIQQPPVPERGEVRLPRSSEVAPEEAGGGWLSGHQLAGLARQPGVLLPAPDVPEIHLTF
jgi:hypothetical protein